MSKTTFKFQGINPHTNLLQDVRNIVTTPDANILIASAYLRRDAVDELADLLSKAGDCATAIIGIRNGATSVQALKAIVKTGIQVYVVDTGATDLLFHPKLYAAYTEATATLICGSANFTPSGLWRNLESVTTTTFDLTDSDDTSAWNDVLTSFEEILAFDHDNVFKLESEEAVDALLAAGRVVDESISVPQTPLGLSDFESRKSVPRIHSKSAKPASSSVAKKPGRPAKTASVADTAAAAAPKASHGTVEVWKSKPLVRRDLNLPDSKGTNPTGSMLLKKGQYPINQQTYFRFDAFADQDWGPRPEKPSYFEYASVKFKFLVNGINYGVHNLEVKYDSRTDTETYLQKQPMASISWGDCKQFLSDENLLDRIMTIYRDEETGIVTEEGNRKNCSYVIEIK